MGMGLIVGLLVFLVLTLIGRHKAEEGFKRLDDAEKLRVIDAFSDLRKWASLPIIVLVIFLLVGLHYLPQYTMFFAGIFAMILLAYLGIMHVLIKYKLAALELPGDYIRACMHLRYLHYVGIAALIAGAVWNVVSRVQ